MALVLLPISRSEEFSRKVLPGLMVLSLSFGINHILAFSSAGHFMLGNLMGFASNFLMVALGVIALSNGKKF